uniref:Uncharacterized protein n=1 Tax=Arundo donax TaxID=35708 RepID=A0A0A8ZN25_ARUDO
MNKNLLASRLHGVNCSPPSDELQENYTKAIDV